MRFIADLHIHSRFSRATSPDLTLPNLYKWAILKGIHVVGTGDFTHPGWLEEIEEHLETCSEEYGLFSLKMPFRNEIEKEIPQSCVHPVRFLLSVEISTVYKKKGKTRKIHHIVFAPSIEIVKKIRYKLEQIGNLKSDGRPILGLDSRHLLEILLEISPEIYLIPAHIWTPWFALFGSKSGFDDIADCFDELTPYIFALETGLSSDPAMNWLCSQLDRFTLVSNSDAHSASKLGREANLFDTELSYNGLFSALKEPEKGKFLGTVEFYPEEGKYHLDGHRKCNSRMTPEQSMKTQGLCPVCGKPITLGVLHRIMELADRKPGAKSPKAMPFQSLIALETVIAEVLGVGDSSKKVQSVYQEMVKRLGAELEILSQVPLEEIEKTISPLFSEAIRRVRAGDLEIAAGYDGEFGTIRIFKEGEKSQFTNKSDLFAGCDVPGKSSHSNKSHQKTLWDEEESESLPEKGQELSEKAEEDALSEKEECQKPKSRIKQKEAIEEQEDFQDEYLWDGMEMDSAKGHKTKKSKKFASASPDFQKVGQTLFSNIPEETAASLPGFPLPSATEFPLRSQVENVQPAGFPPTSGLPLPTSSLQSPQTWDESMAQLNPEQKQAVCHRGSPLLVIAGPGTGKTKTLTWRIAHLVRNDAISPLNILGITFTNKASDEMQSRLTELLGEQASRLNIATFHKLGLRIIRENLSLFRTSDIARDSATSTVANGSHVSDTIASVSSSGTSHVVPDSSVAGSNIVGNFPVSDHFTLLEPWQVEKWLETEIPPETLKEAEKAGSRPGEKSLSIVELISREKALLRTPEETENPALQIVYREYRKMLEKQNAYDLDDLIFRPVQLLKNHEDIRNRYQALFRVIAVDEYQDINFAQYHLLRLLSGPNTDFMAIGDPDQAIYGFRGAEVKFFLQFENDFPNAKKIGLVRNYRSTKPIVEASQSVICHNKTHIAQPLVSETNGTPVQKYEAVTDKGEAEFVVHSIEQMVGGTSYFSFDSGRASGQESMEYTFRSFAVLYRTIAQSKALQEALSRSGMPYQVVDGTSFWKSRKMQNWKDMLQILADSQADQSMKTILGLLPGVGERTIEILTLYAKEKNLAVSQALEESRLGLSVPLSAQNSLADFSRKRTALQKILAENNVARLIREIAALDYAFLNLDRDSMETLHQTAMQFATLPELLAYISLHEYTDEFDQRAEKIALMTIHASKGLEFPVVFLTGCEDGLIPYRREDGEKNQDENQKWEEEERRLFYVGATRARHLLYLTHCKERMLFGKTLKNRISPFVLEIPDTLSSTIETTRKPKPKKKQQGEQMTLF